MVGRPIMKEAQARAGPHRDRRRRGGRRMGAYRHCRHSPFARSEAIRCGRSETSGPRHGHRRGHKMARSARTRMPDRTFRRAGSSTSRLSAPAAPPSSRCISILWEQARRRTCSSCSGLLWRVGTRSPTIVGLCAALPCNFRRHESRGSGPCRRRDSESPPCHSRPLAQPEGRVPGLSPRR